MFDKTLSSCNLVRDSKNTRNEHDQSADLLFKIYTEKKSNEENEENATGNILWNISSTIGSEESSSTKNESNIGLSSSGSLFAIQGRSNYYKNGVLVRERGFEVSLDSARDIQTSEESNDESNDVHNNSNNNSSNSNSTDSNDSNYSNNTGNSNNSTNNKSNKNTESTGFTKSNNDTNIVDKDSEEFRNILLAPTRLTITAKGFDSHTSPISALSLTFLMGKYVTDNIGTRPVLLCKGRVEMMLGHEYDDDVIADSEQNSEHVIKSDGMTIVEHVVDRVIMLTAQVDLPKVDVPHENVPRNIPQHHQNPQNVLHGNVLKNIPKILKNVPKILKNVPKILTMSGNHANHRHIENNILSLEYVNHVPRMLKNILILLICGVVLFQPIQSYGAHVRTYSDIYLYYSNNSYVTMSSILFYVLRAVQVIFGLLLSIIILTTPVRSDFLQDFWVYFGVYFRSTFALSEGEGSRLSFFVHGWNAWGFCGAIRQGLFSFFMFFHFFSPFFCVCFFMFFVFLFIVYFLC